MITANLREVFPNAASDDYGFSCPTREELLESLHLSIVAHYRSGDYSGETFLIVEDLDDHRLGYLTYNWGSCSECDSVYRASSYKDADDIRMGLASSINWAKSRLELVEWLLSQAWSDANSHHDRSEDVRSHLLTKLGTCAVHEDCRQTPSLGAVCFAKENSR